MASTFDSFTAQLLTTLKAAQNRLEALIASSASSAHQIEADIRAKIASLELGVDKAKDKVQAATTVVQKWADDPAATVAGWKASFDVARLDDRASRASLYAEAAAEVATDSIAQAEKATLAAKLAHAEADAARAAKAA